MLLPSLRISRFVLAVVAIEIAVGHRKEMTLLNIHTEKVEKEKTKKDAWCRSPFPLLLPSLSNSEIFFIHYCRYSNERLKK